MKTWRMAGLALIALPLCLADAAPAYAQPVPRVVPPAVAPRVPRKVRPARVAPRPRPPVVAPGVPRPVPAVPRRIPRP